MFMMVCASECVCMYVCAQAGDRLEKTIKAIILYQFEGLNFDIDDVTGKIRPWFLLKMLPFFGVFSNATAGAREIVS